MEKARPLWKKPAHYGKRLPIMEKGCPLWKKLSSVIAVRRSIAYLRSRGGLSVSVEMGETLKAFPAKVAGFCCSEMRQTKEAGARFEVRQTKRL